MDDTDRALKFGLFLDSLCAGVSAMPQDAARAGRAETWCPVRGFESEYLISSYGAVYSVHSKRPLKPYLSKGYPSVGLRMNGERVQRRVHRMVAEAFLGAPDEGLECAHLDGNPLNNRADNLAWVSRQENELHKRAHGTSQANYRRLSPEKVVVIRTGANRKLTRRELATLAGVSLDTLYSLLNGKYYNDASTEPQSPLRLVPSGDHRLSQEGDA